MSGLRLPVGRWRWIKVGEEASGAFVSGLALTSGAGCTGQVSSDKSLALSGISFLIYRKRFGPRISTEAQTVGGPREFPCWHLQSLENSPNAGHPPHHLRAGVHPSHSHELGPSGLNAMLEPKPSSYPWKVDVLLDNSGAQCV